MGSNLPATRDDVSPAVPVERDAAVERQSQPVSVALLPLSLVAFIILAFAIATWTLLHAAG